MTRIGTNHFISLDAAIKYYAYGFNRNEVLEKWRNLEICIGNPAINGEQGFTVDKDGRYWIIEKN